MKEIIVNKKRNIIAFVDNIDVDIFDNFATCGVMPTNHVFLRESGRKGKYTLLHRVIVSRIIKRPLKRKEIVDHIDGNPLNNLRENLRLCTQGQNVCNSRKRQTSNHKGFSFDPNRKKWVVQIAYQGKSYQKRFNTKKQAKEYAFILREKLHKEFANHG